MAAGEKPVQGVQVGSDNTQFNQFGVTDTELAGQLGVAKAALKNFFKILEQQHVPIEEWDHVLRQLADRYQELKNHVGLLESADPEVLALQQQAKQAIEQAEFQTAETLLAKAVDLDITAAETIKANYQKRNVSAAENQALIAESLHTRFLLEEAILAYQQAVQFAKEGQGQVQLAKYQYSLGIVYYDNASYKKAIALFEYALNYYLQAEGEESTNAAVVTNLLGNVWRVKGEYDKAIEYFEHALAANIRVYGECHPEVTSGWNNLGNVSWNKGEYDKAIRYFGLTLAVNIMAYGECHPMVAACRHNLGKVWAEKGQYDKASECFKQALASDIKTYGKEHPVVAKDWISLRRRRGQVACFTILFPIRKETQTWVPIDWIAHILLI